MVLFLVYACCEAQGLIKCDVYQFMGTDSTNKKVVLTQILNSSGQVISETYKGFMENSVEGIADGSYFYSYKDSLLTKRTSIDYNNDSAKMFCYYNGENQLIKEEHFDFKKRLKNNVRCDNCTNEDYENEATWKKVSEINYSYDNSGNKILYDATSLHVDTQDRYTWTYDSLGRVSKYSSFDGKKLLWIEEYSYFRKGYKVTHTWYGRDGNPEHLKTKDSGFVPRRTNTYDVNDKGRVIKETSETEKGETESVKKTFYNPKGQVIRTVCYDNNRQPEVTHVYVYH